MTTRRLTSKFTQPGRTVIIMGGAASDPANHDNIGLTDEVSKVGRHDAVGGGVASDINVVRTSAGLLDEIRLTQTSQTSEGVINDNKLGA